MIARKNYALLAKDHISPLLIEQGWHKLRGYQWEKYNEERTVQVQIVLQKYFYDTDAVVAFIVQIFIYDVENKLYRDEEIRQKLAAGETVESWFGDVAYTCNGEVHEDDDLDLLTQRINKCVAELTRPYLTGKKIEVGSLGKTNVQHYPNILCNGEPIAYVE